MSLLILHLQGSPYEIGLQHARQIQALRGLLSPVIGARLQRLAGRQADRQVELAPALDALQVLDPPLLEMLQGLAHGLDLAYPDLLRYTLSSYLLDRQRIRGEGPRLQAENGCTTWAASGASTREGWPLLAKNRDYHRDHIPLQMLAWVKPANGLRYLTVGSAGSPNVFSSGINEQGLAVADTHVLSRDLGPGLPRYSLMRELLEHHASVSSGLDYLRSVPHMGGGTVILADAMGYLAVCESGHQRSGFLEAPSGHLASTNHFVTAELAGRWIEDEPPLLQGNSPARRRRVLQQLADQAGQVDGYWAQALMTAHGSTADALCRHPLASVDAGDHPSLDSSTISSVLLFPKGEPGRLPSGPGLFLAAGQPCQADWSYFSVLGDEGRSIGRASSTRA